MVNVSKILKYASIFYKRSEDLDALVSFLWDGDPPSVPSQKAAPSAPSAAQPASSQQSPAVQQQSFSSEVPGYSRVLKTPSREIQQISQKILSENRHQPIGTTIPFTYDGVSYVARIETHPPSSRNPKPHPGVSLFVQSKAAAPKPPPQQPTYSAPGDLTERSKRIIAELDPQFQSQVVELMKRGLAAGLRPEIVEGKRSQERQEELYQQGRTKPGPVVTWTRSSMHTKGLAVDIAQLDDNGKITYNASPDFWERMGEIGKSLGMTWGGDWSKNPDRPHFQYKASV